MSRICPCCHGDDIEFIDWKPTYKNVVCSNCKTHPRHRTLVLYLQRHPTFADSHLRLLHFAPHSAVRKYLNSLPKLDYITADIEGYAHGQPVDYKIDATSIPFADNQFDVILCSHVLEHIEQDTMAIKELYRVLKPGGWAFLAVPINAGAVTFEDSTIVDPQLRAKYFGQANHVRYYGTDYKTRLEGVGFKVNELSVAQLFQALSPEERAANGLHDREILHFGTKSPIVF